MVSLWRYVDEVSASMHPTLQIVSLAVIGVTGLCIGFGGMYALDHFILN
jgi:hypothetical protein